MNAYTCKTIQYLDAHLIVSGPLEILDKLIEETMPYFREGNCIKLLQDQYLVSIEITTQGAVTDLPKQTIRSKPITLHAQKVGEIFTLPLEGSFLVRDTTDSIDIVINKKSSSVKIVCSNPSQNQLEILRIIRGLLSGLAQARGYTLGHSAAIEVNGQVVMIAGSKGAGKTSFATTALKSTEIGTRFITNDKCLIGSDWTLWGLPYAIPVSPDCFVDCNEFASYDKYNLRRNKSGKFLFWPTDFVNLFGCGLSEGGQVRLVVIPELDLSSSTVTVHEDGYDNNASLYDILKGGYDDVMPYWLLDLLEIYPLPSHQTHFTDIPLYVLRLRGNPWVFDWLPEVIKRM